MCIRDRGAVVLAIWVAVHPDPASLRKLSPARWNVHSMAASQAPRPSTPIAGRPATSTYPILPQPQTNTGYRHGVLGGETEGLHSLGVLFGQTGEHAADAGQIHARTVRATHQHRGQPVALSGNLLRLAQRLTHQSSTPQCEAAADTRILLDSRAHLPDDEFRVTCVGERLHNQFARLCIQERSDLAVEVSGKPIAHIRLDESFQPIVGRRLGVEFLERCLLYTSTSPRDR